ncbi:hypothetical protein CC80DRAFT_537793 [Byssothecium circinans]|uniref:Rhodopsin domain-containing protein n=1 Tax=Byssothecium circinans TaxID=147558 RepID=A0A6A5TKS7_9PLEO|nr:hypothetical protein CC80DRAFT_537793 [Byssothecium circinans]
MELSQQFALMNATAKAAFYRGPAMKAPPGETYNFINPPNKNAESYGIVITGTALSTIAILLRLYSRLFVGKRVGLRIEDYLAVSAWAIFIPWVYYILNLISSAGVFIHQWNVRYVTLMDFLYTTDACSIIYGVVMGLGKTAILLDWLHIFVPHRQKNPMAYTIYIIMGLNAAYYFAGTVVYIIPCIPRRKFWDATVPGHCIKVHAASVASGGINLVSDIVMLAIPQKIIWGLHVTNSRKAGISALFSIGVFACVCAIARLVCSIKLFLNHEDITYVMSPVGLWTLGEMASLFFILGVPCLSRIFKEVKWLQSAVTRIRSWTGKGTQDNPSRGGLPSWYKRAPTRRKRNDMYSDLEEHTLSEVAHPANTIARETVVEVHHSPK